MQKYYVLDTNVLIDYPDIIPNSDNRPLVSPNIDFRSCHLVVPTAVIRELSNHKSEMSDRGVACRTVLKRIRTLVENSTDTPVRSVYNLGASIPIRNGAEYLDILPVHKDFIYSMPFAPANDDMDGQIILATLTVQLVADGRLAFTGDGLTYMKSDQTVNYEYDYPVMNDKFSISSPTSVILLTNDNGLAIRAYARGVRTARFTYRLPQPYTGRRDVTVPPEMFEQFWLDGCLDAKDFYTCCPDESPLVANEYIVMYPQDNLWLGSFDVETDGRRNYRYIGRYNAYSDLIEPLKPLSNFPTSIMNDGQAMYADALMDSENIDAVICIGPAGSGKTYMATIYAYDACQRGEYVGIGVVPCRIQDDGVGFLPGDLKEKLNPSVQPIKDALWSYFLDTKKEFRRELDKLKKFGATDKDSSRGSEDSDSDQNRKSKKSLKARLDDCVNLTYDNWFGDPIPIAYARGRNFRNQIAMFDEFQDHSNSEAINLFTRIGRGGRIISTGDIEQVHAPYLDKENNGLTYARNLCKGIPYVAQVAFKPSECVRHRLVKAILERLNNVRTTPPTSVPDYFGETTKESTENPGNFTDEGLTFLEE